MACPIQGLHNLQRHGLALPNKLGWPRKTMSAAALYVQEPTKVAQSMVRCATVTDETVSNAGSGRPDYQA